MNKFSIKVFLFYSLLCLALPASAAEINFNLLKSTPVGSWQEREQITTDHRGRTTATVMRSALLGEETRNGKQYYWVEMALQSYKVSKKGKRSKDGDKVILKSLVPATALQADPANALTNLRGFGEEIIMQSGKEQPMRVTGGGGLMSGMMQAMGTEVNYDFAEVGQESVTVPGGTFATTKITGSGSTQTKVVFKTIRVESDSTVWISENVPFGMVKSVGTSTTNGKQSTHADELLAFGLSGAESQITGEPQDLPNLGNIFGK